MNPLANWQRFTERRAAACARQREQDKADAAALAVVEPPREMVFKTFVTPPPPQSPSWDADAWLQGKLEAFAGMLGEEAGEGERRILTTLRAEIAELRSELQTLRAVVDGNATPIKGQRDVAWRAR